MAVSGVHSAAELSELCLSLLAVEEWLREHCPARHATGMADTVGKAYTVIDDLYDTQRELEKQAVLKKFRQDDRLGDQAC